MSSGRGFWMAESSLIPPQRPLLSDCHLIKRVCHAVLTSQCSIQTTSLTCFIALSVLKNYKTFVYFELHYAKGLVARTCEDQGHAGCEFLVLAFLQARFAHAAQCSTEGGYVKIRGVILFAAWLWLLISHACEHLQCAFKRFL